MSEKGDDLVLRTGPWGDLLDPLAPNILLQQPHLKYVQAACNVRCAPLAACDADF